MSRIAGAIMTFVFLTSCSDATAPKSPVGSFPAETVLASSMAALSDDGATTRDDDSKERCKTDVAFTKWYTTSPFMTGFTCHGPGTYAGEVLSRVDNGVTTHLRARYEVTDPRGGHSFQTVIEGDLDNATGLAALTGVVVEGWRRGAPVSVTFQRIRPCELAVGPSVPGVCFQGTIHIQNGKSGVDNDDES